MKKLVAIGLTIVITLFMVGCNGISTKKKIPLTLQNWQDYFAHDYTLGTKNVYIRDIKYGDIKYGREFWGFYTMTVTVTLIKGVALEDVVMKFKWGVDDAWGVIPITVSMPTTGGVVSKTENSHQVYQQSPVEYKPLPFASIEEISGYVIVDNN